MTVEILAFGIVKDILGGSTVKMEIRDGITAEELKAVLWQQHPGLQRLSSFAIAVNNEYSGDEKPIRANDEIAIIPPVSGG